MPKQRKIWMVLFALIMLAVGQAAATDDDEIKVLVNLKAAKELLMTGNTEEAVSLLTKLNTRLSGMSFDNVEKIRVNVDKAIIAINNGQDSQIYLDESIQLLEPSVMNVDNLPFLIEYFEEEYTEGVTNGEIADYVDYTKAIISIDTFKLIVEISNHPEKEELLALSEEIKTAALNKGDVGNAVEELKNELNLSNNADVNKIIAEMLTTLDKIENEYRAGNVDTALNLASTLYFRQYEEIESLVVTKDRELNERIEEEIGILQERIKNREDISAIEGATDNIRSSLKKIEKVLTAETSPIQLFIESFTIIFREGFEAILIVGAVAAYLIKMGESQRIKSLAYGAGIAIIASIITAILMEQILDLSGEAREIVEGATFLIAVVVLFSVSYWLLSKAHVEKWKKYIESRVNGAIATGSNLGLAAISFIAVYREGFETVLFYKALSIDAGGFSLPVVGGFAIGLGTLLVVYLLFRYIGIKMPVRELFAGTSALLYYLAFRFAGKGILELQEAGVMPSTPLGIPKIGFLGIYPTVETSLIQLALIVALLAGILYLRYSTPSQVSA
jgi:high-affinity iron transporter